MYSWDYNLFIGDDTVNVHVGFSAGDTLFLIAESASEDNGDRLKDVIDAIKAKITGQRPSHLNEIQTILDSELHNLDTTLVSFAALYSVQSVLYVFTKGKGEVYIGRDGAMQKLLSGDNNASGYLQEHDSFLLTNTTCSSHLEDDILKELLVETRPKEAIETITPQLKGADNAGMIALFMQAHTRGRGETADTEVVEDEFIEDRPSEEPVTPIVPLAAQPAQQPSAHTGLYTNTPEPISTSTEVRPPRFGSVKDLFVKLQSGTTKSKKLTFIVVLVLLGVLTWSVVSGNARRQKAQFIEKVTAQEAIIDGKLSEAEDLAGVNTQRSLDLLDESRQILTELQQEARQKELASLPELSQMADRIASVEQSIKKTEKGTFTEFYDLNLIQKGASAQSMYTDGEWIVLLDRKKGQVYMLDSAEKSVDTYSAKQISQASFVAVHQDVPYIFGPSVGVIKLADTQKGEVVIKKDAEWKSIKDFWMYSGNIYLLDDGVRDVYKYLVAEEGYSSRRSYTGGPSTALAQATAMAIDSSVYIAAGSSVIKYTSGTKESFPVAIPDEGDVTFEDIFTSQEVDNIYLLDTDSQRIFIVTKEGSFEKQISASILKGADDFIVDPEHGILVLAQDTIYQIKE